MMRAECASAFVRKPQVVNNTSALHRLAQMPTSSKGGLPVLQKVSPRQTTPSHRRTTDGKCAAPISRMQNNEGHSIAPSLETESVGMLRHSVLSKPRDIHRQRVVQDGAQRI